MPAQILSPRGDSPRGGSPRGGSPRRAASPSRERMVQQEYWKEHTSALDGATVEAMMLDSQAASLDLQERPEVMAMLGPVGGQKVVELGAGIGRFTGALAATAKSVLAVDFMDNLIAENRKTHGHRKNIEHLVGDATELDLEEGGADVVFSNWLLMYLDDDEVYDLASDALAWLSEGGVLFFRESCFKQSGDKPRKNNPTHYRNPREYFKIVDETENAEPDGRYSHFELVSCKCVDTYVRVKQNQNQICWKWRKVVTDQSRSNDFRNFLDNTQYNMNGILRYERIFGEGFVSTGGAETTKEFLGMLKLKPNERVLDVGCGVGGGDFLMAGKYDVFCHGIDLSVNMVLIALERASEAKKSKVSFEIADIMTCDLRPNFYDVIYSRDTILHIEDKLTLFKRFQEMLKPGGRLLITDYCRAAQEPSPDFAAYISQRGYHLHPVQEYGQILSDAGFYDVSAEDRTWQMETSLQKELDRTKQDKDKFVSEFSENDYDDIINGWQNKLERLNEQKWGLFTAVKTMAEE